MNVVNRKAVQQLCDVVGLRYDAVSTLKIEVALPGIVTAHATFYVLPEQEMKPQTAKPATKKGNK